MNQQKVDYIIVGCGLAGIAFCEQLRKNHKSFIVFDDDSQQSSVVAAGIFNPVVLKRFTPVWKAKEQLEIAMLYYEELEDLLGIQIKHDLRILRKFTSVEEQNDWFSASDHPLLEEYLSTPLLKNKNPLLKANLGFGKVSHTGRVDTKSLIGSYKAFLEGINAISISSFNFSDLKIEEKGISYQNFTTNHIVFSEGFGIKKNPFFKELPLNGTKGEMLIIEAPELKLDNIIKSSVFIVPLEEDRYWIGATYNRDDKSYNLTSEAKEELSKKLKTLIECDYEIIEHQAGMRPTTKDRRPLVGTHSNYKNVHVLNGLGTRGVMISPYVAKQLFSAIEDGAALDSDIDIKRFKYYGELF